MPKYAIEATYTARGDEGVGISTNATLDGEPFVFNIDTSSFRQLHQYQNRHGSRSGAWTAEAMHFAKIREGSHVGD